MPRTLVSTRAASRAISSAPSFFPIAAPAFFSTGARALAAPSSSSTTPSSSPSSSSSPSPSSLTKHYARLSTLWPKDRLRPDTSFVKSVIQHREARLSSPSVSPSASSSSSPSDSSASAPQSTPHALSSQKELCEINALYALVDNRFSKKYPVSQELLRPASNPTYYEDLLRDFEAAPTRRWWQLWALKLKGMVRWE